MAPPSKRRGMTPVVKPEEKQDNGIYLDRPINDTDIWVVSIGGKDVITSRTGIEKLKRPVHGIVKMRFIEKDGRRCEKFNLIK